MRPERLLQHFETISDAPEAVVKLRRLVLNLAVRGKLAEQDGADESACKLIDRVNVARARLVASNAMRNSKAIAAPNKKTEMFGLPSGWVWSIADQLWDFENGDRSSNYPSKHQLVKSGIPFVNAGHLQNGAVCMEDMNYITQNKFESLGGGKLRFGDQIYCLRGSLGKHAVYNYRIPAAIASSLVILRPVLPDLVPFLRLYLDSDVSTAFLKRYDNGTAQPNLSSANLRRFEIPVPPLAEQHRIVAKVNELMAMCDQLDAARTRREATRDQLAAASLARLNTPDPDTFPTDAGFVLDALPSLTTRPDQITQLRITLLNLAVRGKLVPQNSSDEPASELLKRIASEKARLAKMNMTGMAKLLPALAQQKNAPELPEGWAWVRLGNVCQLVTSGSRDWAKYYSNDGAIFLRMGNLSKGHYRLRLDHLQHVKPPVSSEGTRTRLEGGDILVSITGEVGMLGLVPEDFGEAYINQHTAMVRPMPELKGRYLPELLRSSVAQDQFNEPQRGIKNSFRLTDVTQLVVPLPPIAEQHRIVAKIDELMSLCDQLEIALTHANTTRSRLLDALLHEALAPALVAAA